MVGLKKKTLVFINIHFVEILPEAWANNLTWCIEKDLTSSYFKN